MTRNTPRTARKRHTCWCGYRILPGERYLECVISPYHGDIYNTTWWRAAECAPCATECGRGAGL